MHTVVVQRDLAASQPALVGNVDRAFVEAKEAAADRYRQGRRLYESKAWRRG